ncbi:hypothetical protein DFH08DRAFT_713145, partial [Mycena albidolilacea]
KEASKIAENCKRTFSRDVWIHFVGVWDTVSSVGVFRGKPLPLTLSVTQFCTFRHALALDEYHVKFLPEYIDSGSSATSKHKAGHHPIDVKEVWFAGSHSDMYVDPPNLNDSDTASAGSVVINCSHKSLFQYQAERIARFAEGDEGTREILSNSRAPP